MIETRKLGKHKMSEYNPLAEYAIKKLQDEMVQKDKEERQLAESTARRRIQLKIVEECMWDDIKSGEFRNVSSDPVMQEYMVRYNKLQDQKELSSHGRGAKYMYVTVNPSEDDLESLLVFMESLCESNWFKHYTYTYEQRAEGDLEPYGFHVHILFKLPEGKPPSDVKKCLLSKLKHSSVVGNWNSKNPYVRYIKDMKNLQKIENYIKGVKETGKLGKVEKDKKWRIENGLRDYYQFPNEGEETLSQV